MAKIVEVKTDLEKMERVKNALVFAEKWLRQRGGDAEGYLISFHVVRKGRITHQFNYQDFPVDDWGKCLIATGVEARVALMNAQTGRGKVE